MQIHSKKGILVIYEKEEAYAVGLSGYLNRSLEFPYQVAVFTSQETLDRYLEEERADILLVGESCAYETKQSVRRILLTEDRREGRELPWVFKYQSAGNIMREITAYAVGNEKQEGAEGKEGPRVYTIFATRAGQERSKFARQLVRELQAKGEVLYLNLDLFPSESCQEAGEWKGMSEVVYYLKQGGEQIRWKIKALIGEEEGMKQIRPARCSMDLLELTPEDIGLLLRVFQEMPEFQHIVLEIGFYNETMLELCRLSHQICLVSPDGTDYTKSSEAFLEQLSLMQLGGVERKVELVRYQGAEGGNAARTGTAGADKTTKPLKSAAAGGLGRLGLFS